MSINSGKRPTLEDLNAVLDLARDKSNTSREILLAKITDWFEGTEHALSESERVLSEDILRRIVEDVEITIRQALAERLAVLPTAPRGLLEALSGDDISVAMPILTRSTVLRDTDLINVIQHKSVEHLLAVAMRELVSPDVSEALVETGDESVVVALLQNKGAKFFPNTLLGLVDASETTPAYQAPLLDIENLDPMLAARMYTWVSDALRTRILEKFDVDATALDDAMAVAVQDASGSAESVEAGGGGRGIIWNA